MVQDRPQRMAHADSVAPRVSLRGSVLDFTRGFSRKERKLLNRLLVFVKSGLDKLFSDTIVGVGQSNVTRLRRDNEY